MYYDSKTTGRVAWPLGTGLASTMQCIQWGHKRIGLGVVGDKRVPNFATLCRSSCSFDNHGLILIILGKQHQHTFKNDTRIRLFCPFTFTYSVLYLLLNCCNGNDAKSLLKSPLCCAVGRRSPSHWWFPQLFQSLTALNYFSSNQDWKLTANTTVKFCWRSRYCQSCFALLATRPCGDDFVIKSRNRKLIRVTSPLKQSSSFSRKHRILSVQICVRQTVRT